jgi:cell wall-associated NlpC family hydrolase
MRKFVHIVRLGGRERVIGAVVFALFVSACTSAPRYTSGPSVTARTPAPVPAESDRQEIVHYAKTFLGTPYRDGGTTRNGLDCSGLVMTVYDEFDIRLPRTSLDQSRVGSDIALARMKPGDLVFFKTSRAPVSHVGIYIGSGRFIHASTSARSVRIDDMDSAYFRPRFVTARRLLDS